MRRIELKKIISTFETIYYLNAIISYLPLMLLHSWLAMATAGTGVETKAVTSECNGPVIQMSVIRTILPQSIDL